MEKPYIIWTMRRTGGTTLANIVAQVSSYSGVEHEPYNPDRVFGQITRRWGADADLNTLSQSMRETLENSPIIKHCYEVVPTEVNLALMREANMRNYHHILLLRKSEVDRIFSLQLAQQTGVWGPSRADVVYRSITDNSRTVISLEIKSAIQHMTDCLLRTRWLTTEFRRAGVGITRVAFEELYGSRQRGINSLKRIFLDLGLDDLKVNEVAPIVAGQLKKGSQDSSRLSSKVENLVEWRAAMQNMWDFLNKPSDTPNIGDPSDLLVQSIDHSTR